jgi:hypothetical protein
MALERSLPAFGRQRARVIIGVLQLVRLSLAGVPIMKSTLKKILHPMLFIAGLLLVQQSVACQDDDPSDDLSVRLDCSSYCEQAQLCNGDVNRAECEDDCEDALGECQANELDQVQEQLDNCAEESCDDFTGCSIDAGAQCFFGL